MDNGTIKCWGRNQYGQLGLGDVYTRGDGPGEMGDNLPAVDLGTGRTATAVTGGSSHTCALLDDGTIKCWGYNTYGQLGSGSSTGDDNRLGDQPGEMGDGLPAVDLGTGGTAAAVTGGSNHTCALLDDHTVKCWGFNYYGGLGLGDNGSRGDQIGEMGDDLLAVALGTGRTALAVTAGDQHTCAVLDDDALKCWGHNQFGRLGLGDTASRGDGPGEMGDDLPAVDMGDDAVPRLVVVSARQVGRAVSGTTAELRVTLLNAGGVALTALAGTPGCEPIADLAVGAQVEVTCHSAVDATDVPYGAREVTITSAQLDPVTASVTVVVERPYPRRSATVAAGGRHTCAVVDLGAVKCWGDNQYGQLGVGDTANRGDAPGEMGDELPTVDLGTGRTATAIAVGDSHTCALLDDGTVKCWGNNDHGQLGLGDIVDRGVEPDSMGDDLPTVDLGTGRTATAIAAGAEHTCAVLDDDTVKCWGYNGYVGQLGLGDIYSRGNGPGEMGDNLPAVDLGTGHTATSIAAGHNHTCAVLDDGTVKCWGYNRHGQLGLGDIADRGDEPGQMGDSLPTVDLGTARTATAITAGGTAEIDGGADYTCALLDDGTVKCWGNNQYGKLGLGDTTNRGDQFGEMGDHLPAVDLGTGRAATSVAAGGSHICAVLDDGTVKCWGYNGGGQLGLGDTANRGDQPGEMGDHLPAVDLGTGRAATEVTAGAPRRRVGGGTTDEHSCAVLNDGAVKCWGYNVAGQLGLGLGDHNARGNEPDEMGDALPVVDLGAAVSGVRGRVTETASGEPVGGAWVALLSAADYAPEAAGYASATGDFGVAVAPGEYRLYTIDPTGGHTSALHPAVVTVADHVAEASPTLDAAVGRVAGTVVTDGTAAAVAGAVVLGIDTATGEPDRAAVTGADGSYRLDGLAPGNRLVITVDPSGAHQPEYHQNTPYPQSATPVAVTAGATATIDLSPPPATAPTGATVSGTVTTAGTDAPVPGAVLIALRAANNSYAAGAVAGPDGTYTMTLSPGGHRILVLDPAHRHRPEWHPDHPVTDLAGAPITTINPGANTVDADLAPLTGTLRGLVRYVGGDPADHAWIVAVSPTGTIAGAAVAGDDGRFTLAGLAAGTYRVTFADPHHGRPQQWWNHRTSFATANALTVTAGATTTIHTTLADP